MNRIERLTAILLLLQQKPRTSEEIARRFEISKRTVLRDVQALSEMGVPVIAREGAGGGYSLPGDFLIDPLPLTSKEAFLLLLSLSAINQLSDAPFAEERTSLMAKLRALLPHQHLADVEKLLSRVDVQYPGRAGRAPFLDAIIAAVESQRWVKIGYRSTERESTIHLLPRQIYMQNGLWYCRAYAYENGEERTYRVDRVQAVEPAEIQSLPAEAPARQPYDHPSHPEVIAELTSRGVGAVESDNHIGQSIQRRPDGTGRLAFRCPPGELSYFARFFAGLGDEVTVQAPGELRERLRDLAEKMIEKYSER